MPNDESLVTLKKQRAIVKGSCTRIKTFVDSVNAINPTVAAHLEERKLKLNQYWSDYNAVQSQIELKDEAEGNDRVAFEDAFYAVSSRIRELLCPPSHSRLTASSPSTVSETSDAATRVRLPKLNMPTFSGKYDEWFPFCDTFASVIHSNSSLSAIQKFQYLRASLTGDASSVINSLEISDANYDVAWTLLKERYDNKLVIVQNHIKAIFELPSMSRENYIELRQIADGATKHIHALRALKRPVYEWDDILIHVLCAKLDSLTQREWRSSLSGTELPTVKQFFEFITHQCQMLEATSKSNPVNAKNIATKHNAKRQTACVATVKTKCNYCKGEHSIYYCKDFLALPVNQRISEIRTRKFCLNCLRSNSHNANKCTSGVCKICQAKHNTLLHIAASAQTSNTPDGGGEGDNRDKPTGSSNLVTAHANGYKNDVMLATAMVQACNQEGTLKPCRVLLDCGSQANLISRQFLAKLGLSPRSSNLTIAGVNGTVSTATQFVEVKIQSRVDSYSTIIDCIVTDRVTERLPGISLKRRDFKLPRNIKLADPQFHVSSEIDILIGAEIFWDLLCVGQIPSSVNQPRLQKTRFGWILAGRNFDCKTIQTKVRAFHATISNEQLHDQLSKFWQLDSEINRSSNYNAEENYVEQHFLNNVRQNDRGRYVVKLPAKEELIGKLRESRNIAMSRLDSLEKRFKRQPEMKKQYEHFIHEYLELGHMKRVIPQVNEDTATFYLPHHCVFKSKEKTPKIRVVFDASCKTDANLSLNDVLLVGPVVQLDLVSILIRFRCFIYVFSADIIKMYRQILVDPSQISLQRILWRDDPTDEVDTYELLTVTYGTSPASYLATRCLNYHADQHASKFPIGSAHVKRGFYVDDFLSGADTLPEAMTLRNELIELLKLGSFELSKWASNCPDLLQNLKNRNDKVVTIHDEAESNLLGVQWSQAEDIFYFSYQSEISNDVISKRTILSEVARLFDPLGLLGPTIVIAKLILQELWKTGTHWDESLPQELHTRWLKFKTQLHMVNQLQIPRCVKTVTDVKPIQLHGFADASQDAYGACVYIRSDLGSGNYRSELLSSKSRVAPLKAVSLPRLELSAAVLLARLVSKVKDSLEIPMQTFLWSDSMITLNWITSASRNWSTFVANRVGEIQRLTQIGDWRHIASQNNPADVLSRGLYPQELITSTLWWHGPDFLHSSEDSWPSGNFAHLNEDIPERKRVITLIARVEPHIVNELLVKYSSINKICRIVAYCMRFRKIRRPDTPTREISSIEMSFAMEVICKGVQEQVFSSEYEALKHGKSINSSSRLLSLSPFMNEDGLIRVGGRLKNSNLNFAACHPILLPRNHDLTRKLIREEHIRSMHAGTQATMASIRQRFWPLSLRSATRKIVQECVICFKSKPRQSEAIMGVLPTSRVTPSKPFTYCGVDYAGPIVLREGTRRNARNHKAYIAIFVCFSIKATHIELVSNLTTDAFLGAFKRFIARRGKPTRMYSDNGTTFVGAQRQLEEFYEFYRKQETRSGLDQFLSDQGIAWSFIPPNAPHFGGLWEAAVKSAKYHMSRIVGQAHLTYEEMQTVLSEIEAILNSRPITPLSEDPNDLLCLTPGHFLIGTALNSFPCDDISDIKENRLVRWQRVEQLRQHFWRRWSVEYLNLLQERTRWKRNTGTQLRANQLVLVKQQNLAPLQWMLGRVIEIHPGTDNVARAATVRTAKGTFVRPLTRLAILLVET